MVKRLFVILVFLMATLLAYLAADMVTFSLKKKLDVPPVTLLPSSRERKEADKNVNQLEFFQIIGQRDLFQLKPPKDGTKQQTDEEKVAPLSALKLKLLGTMIGNGIVPFAIILDQSANKQDLYTEGDMVGPAQVAKIYRHKVILTREGTEEMLLAFEEMEILSIEAGTSQSGETTQLPAPQRQAPSRVNKQMGKKISENHWVLERGEVQDIMTNSSQYLTQVRIIPHFMGGKLDDPDGFQVANIAPRSLFDMMGLRNGDVIKSVNRQPIQNAEKAIEAYQRFRNESQIEVIVLRNNKEITLRYDITD